MKPYTGEFYKLIREGARRSAEEIIPLVLEWVRPRSVIDVGCGVGAWLSVVRECGVEDVWGEDGDYIDRSLLMIPEDHFLPSDLNQPPALDKRFDLVISLEVAEHLPRERAAGFIEYLTGLGPVVLFSAAIPHQGGESHLNEQWPDYWAGLFEEQGFVAVDCLRGRFWSNENVEWWYAQNMLLFVRRDHPALDRLIERGPAASSSRTPRLVHPQLYLRRQREMERLQEAPDPKRLPLKLVLSWLPMLAGKAARKRLGM